MTSAAHEDYLRAIYLLLQRGEKATNAAISNELGVAPASATNMVKHLSALGFVAYTPYHGVVLTPEGEKIALEVVRYHRLLELYMTEALNIPWDKVHAEADRLEHAVSGEVADAIERALGHPTADPHGDPIPNQDLSLPQSSTTPLSEQAPGALLTLVRVAAQDEAQLRYLGQLGLYPASVIRLQGTDIEGNLLVAVEGQEHVLPRELAAKLFVQPVES